MKTIFITLGILALTGCSVLQGAYNSEARSQCRELPTTEERLACERAATDAERERRQDKL